ncbi:MAG: transcriptional repressor LexA [Burkholderiaceae bacterium]
MKALTPRQQQILDMIASYIEKRGFPPTRAEICEALGFKSPNAAEEHLKALVKKGAISMVPGASRGIKLSGSPEKEGCGYLSLPLIGRVAAGAPILAAEHVEEEFNIDPSLFSIKPDYLLRVKGMSMKDAGILEDDLLIVHKISGDCFKKITGKIVVARIEEEVTVKRFFKKSNMIFLEPENSNFKTIKVDIQKQPIVIEGLGVGVIRNSKLGL